MESIIALIHNLTKILVLIFGVILFISPPKMLNYFLKKDLEKLRNSNEKINENRLIKSTRKICKVGGVYCIAIILVDKFIRYSALSVIMGYFIIPFIGLYFLDKN